MGTRTHDQITETLRRHHDVATRFCNLANGGELGALGGELVAEIAYRLGLVAGAEARADQLERDVETWRANCMASDELGSSWAEKAVMAMALLKRVPADIDDDSLYGDIRAFLGKHGG